MNKRASISAGLRADATGWKKGCDTARAETEKLKKDTEATTIDGPKMSGFKRSFTEINSRATAAKNVAEAAWAALNKPMAANAWYQDLKDGLSAAMGDVDKAAEHMGKLRLISDEQSLSDDQFEMLVEYSIRLQSLGHSAEYATDFLREMSNTGEWMGKGIENMSGLVEALDKVGQSGDALGKADVSLKSIMALTKETPALRSVVKAAFGTNSAKELEEMNLSAQELTDGLLRGMKAVETSTPGKDEAALAVEGRKKQWMGADSADNNGTLPDRVVGSQADLSGRLAEERARKELASRSAINAKLIEANLADQDAADLEAARNKGDQEYIDTYEKKAELAKIVADLEKGGAKVAEDQIETIKRQIDLRREDARIQKEMQAVKDAEKADKDLTAAGLRHRGKNRKADKAEDAAEVDRLVADNLPRDVAEDLVRRQREQKEDEKLGPGRRRIRSLRDKPGVPGRRERDHEVPVIPADVAPPLAQQKPGKGAAPAGGGGVGGDAVMAIWKKMAADTERTAKNTEKTAAEQQQPAKRS